jgi:hypothetical protein
VDGITATANVLHETVGEGRPGTGCADARAGHRQPATAAAWLMRVAAAVTDFAAGTNPGETMWAPALAQQAAPRWKNWRPDAVAALPTDAVFDTSMTRMPTLRELAAWPVPGHRTVTDLAPAERERQQQLAQQCEHGSTSA